ncbi:uncharacterized protein LOC114257938 [Camellia sinensis]|uniref:uncharacterized protein LOC114257938 n=1 Tax=Camellia sinensis TaxID=4442 RepID=UPI0010359298|nr:uncharacterized protein LOC114257938 [Camellia sinensis]
MGSGCSRLALRPSRPQLPDRPRPNRSFLSSLFICGGSTSHAPTQMEDEPSKLLLNSKKHRREPVVDELQSLTKESSVASGGLVSPRTETETGASSESSVVASEESCSEDGTASTSYDGQSFSGSVSANLMSNLDVVNGIGNVMDKNESQICKEVIHPSDSSPQQLGDSHSDEVSVENHASEGISIRNSVSDSASVVSDSQVISQSLRDDSVRETTPQGLGFLVSDRERIQRSGSVLHVDVVSISSSNLSNSATEISNREARRNSRRLFWDAFSRRSSRRHNDSPTFVFSTDDTDGLGFHDRWLLDFSGDFFDDGAGGDSGYMGNRIHSMNERRRHSRSEVWERLHSGHERGNPRSSRCPSGLHADGTCSCESTSMPEESGTRASISRIVMLAEALFEVLDEIHRQPMSLSLSVVSLPAPEAVVDTLPVKHHKNSDVSESADDVVQCYICLSEYEEGDKIRVLPCHHEFHMSCVDKWLKEIHGVCPLCRGDVREGFTEEPVCNSEIRV